MITATAVTVVVNGAIVSGFAPARFIAGRVVAPLAPIVVRLVSRAAYLPESQTIALERGSVRIVVPVLFVADGVPYVELGPLVRAIGGSAAYDPATKTVSIVLAPNNAIATPAPYAPPASPLAPTTVFTPAPPAPTPRRTETSEPSPRRTAIPAAPSEPVPAPSSEPITPRR